MGVRVPVAGPGIKGISDRPEIYTKKSYLSYRASSSTAPLFARSAREEGISKGRLRFYSNTALTTSTHHSFYKSKFLKFISYNLLYNPVADAYIRTERLQPARRGGLDMGYKENVKLAPKKIRGKALVVNFLSLVDILNYFFASFANKFFFIRKSDIYNNFEIIICLTGLFGIIAPIYGENFTSLFACAGNFSITLIIQSIIVLAFIISNNYNTIKGKIVDRLHLLINIGIIIFFCSFILFIFCCLFASLGVDLGFSYSDIKIFIGCLIGLFLLTILVCNVLYANITLYSKYTGKDYINKVSAYS